jgi:hypothetical protein
MISQRFVSTNPQANLGVSGLARVPQQARAIPRRTAEPLLTVTHCPWSSPQESFLGSTTLEVSDSKGDRNLPLKRCIFHPGFDEVIEYPYNPDRTTNYYRSAIRKHAINVTPTLGSTITIRDPQAWDEVLISETWEGGAKRLSVLAEFFDVLHLFRITEPALGRNVGWIPKDLGFQRHMIQPLNLTVGGSNVDVGEMRTRLNTSLESHLDRQVVFTFRLIRPMPLIDSLLVMEGR